MNLPEYCKTKGFICAIWCVDSETSEEVLVDLYNNQKIAKRIHGKIVDPEFKEEING